MRLAVTTVVLVLLASIAGAATEADTSTGTGDRGREVVERHLSADDGYASSAAVMHMTIRDRRGATTTRRLEIRTLEGQAPQGDRSVIRFLSPGDIAGTALLSYSHVDREDQQWLFLPSLRRVKRISAANQSGPFVGSEFAYEDLTGQELDKFDYEWLREEALDGLTCDVVRRAPRYKRSGYAYQVLWIDQDIHQVRKIHYFNRGERHSKTLVLSQFEHFLSRFYRPKELQMVNHLSGRETALTIESQEFDLGLGARDFDQADFASR